jgi:alpha-mannosidase
VFNHQPFPFEGVIETEDIGFGLTPDETLRLTDANGREVPQQLVPAHTMCQRVRLVAKVAIPPLGYTMLRQHKVKKTDIKPAAGSVTSRGASLRNEFLELTLNDDGYLMMRDLRTGEDVFTPRGENGGAGCVPVLLRDRTDTWSHRVDRYHGSMGRFELVDAETIEPGPIRGRLRVTYRFRDSLLRLDFVLGSGEPFVVVDGRADWRERWKILKLSMRTGLDAKESTAEVPFGTASRVCDGREWPMSQWVDIAAGGRGLAVANNCKHGYSAHGPYGPNQPGELRISLLRSPPHAYDDTVPADFDYPHYHFTDQGAHEFKLALVPHAGDWGASRVIEIARLLNRPPTCLAETFHRGPLPTTGGFLRCEGEGVYVTAIKPAEDGGGWIVRAAEWHGKATTAKLALPTLKRRWSAKFGPWQLKTFFVPARASAKVREANLIEDTL